MNAQDLIDAISNDTLELHYMPIVELGTRNISWFKGLLRWTHPKDGVISPNDIVIFAEQNKLIDALTDWVIEEAALQVKRWEPVGIKAPIIVKVSVMNLQDHKFPDHVLHLFHTHDVLPANVAIEVSESSIASDYPKIASNVKTLEAIGMKIIIDDFGTGSSSLIYLRHMPAHSIKIHRAFIGGVSKNKNCKELLQSIIKLIHDLGLTVIAEGVETKEVWDMLIQMRCDQACGYYLCKPAAATEITNWVVDYLKKSV